MLWGLFEGADYEFEVECSQRSQNRRPQYCIWNLSFYLRRVIRDCNPPCFPRVSYTPHVPTPNAGSELARRYLALRLQRCCYCPNCRMSSDVIWVEEGETTVRLYHLARQRMENPQHHDRSIASSPITLARGCFTPESRVFHASYN